MKDKAIHIIVTCTKRKSRPVPRELQLGTVPGRSVHKVSATWLERLQSNRLPLMLASELYAGDQWQIAKSLPEVAYDNGIDACLWICSAGYGLVPASAMIHPYSATFSASHPDSVRRLEHGNGLAIATWWERLMEWRGPVPSACRSLTELARRYPSRPILVVASPVYLGAMRTDLEAAASALESSDLLTIVSAGSERRGPLAKNILPCDSRLQPVLGGALMSLNVRVARKLLADAGQQPLRCQELAVEFEKLLYRQPDRVTFRRATMTDLQVRTFIQDELKRDNGARPSPLLRRLRDLGRACEQKRFRLIFESVRGNDRVG